MIPTHDMYMSVVVWQGGSTRRNSKLDIKTWAVSKLCAKPNAELIIMLAGTLSLTSLLIGAITRHCLSVPVQA